MIFLGGLWAVGNLLRVLERRLVARGFNPPRVRTLKRWVMVLAALVLLLLTLNAARIPHTVFAFLGNLRNLRNLRISMGAAKFGFNRIGGLGY